MKTRIELIVNDLQDCSRGDYTLLTGIQEVAVKYKLMKEGKAPLWLAQIAFMIWNGTEIINTGQDRKLFYTVD